MTFLTAEELQMIVFPLKQAAAQCRFLDRIGIRYIRNPAGFPVAYRQTNLLTNVHTTSPNRDGLLNALKAKNGGR